LSHSLKAGNVAVVILKITITCGLVVGVDMTDVANVNNLRANCLIFNYFIINHICFIYGTRIIF